MGKNKVDNLYVYGISDRILTPRGIEYLCFFEADEQYSRYPGEFWHPVMANTFFRTFKTPNGFHVIGDGTTDAEGKKFWFAIWKHCYPNSDYILNVENVLKPHSKEEIDYIYRQMPPDMSEFSPRVVKYYRDKAVFESFDEISRISV